MGQSECRPSSPSPSIDYLEAVVAKRVKERENSAQDPNELIPGRKFFKSRHRVPEKKRKKGEKAWIEGKSSGRRWEMVEKVHPITVGIQKSSRQTNYRHPNRSYQSSSRPSSSTSPDNEDLPDAEEASISNSESSREGSSTPDDSTID